MYQTYITEKIEEILTSTDSATSALTKAMVAIHESHPAFYWVGIYRLEGQMLRLGPFSGPATDHVEIPVGRGVCGTAVMTGEDQLVGDVSILDNYLACNLHTKSELVSLIRDDAGRILGQIDIDATEKDLFTAADAQFFSDLGRKLAKYLT